MPDEASCKDKVVIDNKQSVEEVELLKIEQACHSGGLCVIAGDWELCRRVKERLEKSGKYAVCQSMAIEKQKVRLQTLMMAVCYDLAGDWQKVKEPRSFEQVGATFRQALEAAGKPVVLFVVHAQDLPTRTRAEIGTLFKLAGSNHLAVVLFEDPEVQRL
ncbi:MAG: hypothetical protein C0508_00285 [Cyanobacteria bacterium PR.023]|nr:hypothetical protein [Cyanobacteria bacterium PR.023]